MDSIDAELESTSYDNEAWFIHLRWGPILLALTGPWPYVNVTHLRDPLQQPSQLDVVPQAG